MKIDFEPGTGIAVTRLFLGITVAVTDYQRRKAKDLRARWKCYQSNISNVISVAP
ncbi:hypothetical protein [Segetibacter sp. 3557_3]|uniref:hypothetical protein n=1 Tax=Segetibacter sp. 3557_3 TaxID=2547429 RepID=UPI0014051F3E|nr:hypothetical protein [Segetibacter sp. 3557_3]